ncbi:MAG: aminotransferase class I/II-fold pyridoxal phosphate-dependent enzyme [Alphaproteobacteria bacterium]|nr:aminotransferase class I/II-fold pyridoxal phosphate-dependent enzyme [Alphaproteobacteria bacterium]
MALRERIPVQLDRSISPTTASTRLFRNAASYHEENKTGRAVINMGQGAETEKGPKAILGNDVIYTPGKSDITPRYNGVPGGEMAVRERAGAWLGRFLGVSATAKNTFVLPMQGRVGLREGITYSFNVANGNKIALPGGHWPMVSGQVQKNTKGAEIVHYSNPKNDYDNDISEILKRGNLFAVYTNGAHHNPTGKNYGKKYAIGLQADLEEINKGAKTPVVHILDIPYFHALKQNTDLDGPYYDHGIKELTDPDSETPWIAVISFSKALGTATPGLSFVVTHPKIAADVEERLMQSIGVAYNPAYMAQIYDGFGPDKDAEHLKHYQNLRDKYITNQGGLVKTAKPQNMVDGDPGMTSLMKLGPEFQKRRIDVSDGHYDIKDGNDFIEAMLQNFDWVGVNNGVDKEGNLLIRTANAEPTERYAQGLQNLKEGLEHIKNSPRIPGM